ncbi:MAG: thioredoxin [Candidatus Hadarchaeaceae archaeon]
MDELERIKLKKMKQLMGMTSTRRGYPNTPIALTDASLEEVVNRYPLVVIDCWAPWCYPCLMVAPIIDELAKRYAGRIVFGKLNVDENPRAARAFGIMSIPTLLIMKGGKEVDRIVGALPKPHIIEKLRAHLVGR